MPFSDFPSLIDYQGFCGLQTLLICFWFAFLVPFLLVDSGPSLLVYCAA